MSAFKDVYEAIDKEDFALSTLQLIENLVNDILNGTANFPRYTIPEHAGLCTAGSALIGASIIASYARASLTASGNAESGQSSPSNWQIDELQEQLIEQWAKASRLWVEKTDEILTSVFGPMIAQGAEAKSFTGRVTRLLSKNVHRFIPLLKKRLKR